MSDELAKRGAELLPTKHKGHMISSRVGTYTPSITVDLVKKLGGKIVTVKDITKVQYGRITERNEQYVRRQISKAVTALLRAGVPAIPLYDPEGHHQVTGIKVLTEYDSKDMEKLNDFKEAAEARGDLSYEKVKAINKVVEELQKKKPDERPQ